MTKSANPPFSMYRESGSGRIINSRCHRDSMEILEITSGSVTVQIGTDSMVASAGDFLYVPPSMMLRVMANESHASVRGIIFNIAMLEEDMENFDSEVFDMFYIQSKNKMTVFSRQDRIHGAISALMQDCFDEYSVRDVCYKLPIRANIYRMVAVLLRNYSSTKNELDRMIYHNVLRLRPVMNYITDNFREKIYIEMLADMISVSPDYFTKMFKESIGKTPIDYINAMRVNYSMELLSTTDKTMAEIADDIGFCNPNYFHKIFKQYMDVSPLSYRKSTK